jgi:hypothetical protein
MCHEEFCMIVPVLPKLLALVGDKIYFQWGMRNYNFWLTSFDIN